MCTTAAKQLGNSWFLSKTRDPVSWMRWEDEIRLYDSPADKCRKLLVQNPIPHEDGYYGGINEHGVALVATYVNVAENQISYIRRPYVRLILDARSSREAVKIIESFSPRIGGNIFIADPEECYGIEAIPDRYYVEKVTRPSVKTNHFLHLPNRNLAFDREPGFEQWSHDHQRRAEELIAKARNVQDLKAILRDRKNSQKKTAICTVPEEDKCCTYSAFIFDTQRKTAYYCQGNPLKGNFRQYGFG